MDFQDPSLHRAEASALSGLPISEAVSGGRSELFIRTINPECVQNFAANMARPGDAETVLNECFTSSKIQADFSGFEASFGGLPTASAHFNSAIAKFMENKINFLDEVAAHLEKDLTSLGEKFSFSPKDIDKINIQFLTADAHNHGKSPLIITFVMRNGQKETLVYKPRVMEFERIICDIQQGAFNLLNHQLKNVYGDCAFPTYEILACEGKETNSVYGYSRFLGGNSICNEQSRLKPFAQFIETGDLRIFNQKFHKFNDYDQATVRSSFFGNRTEAQLQKDYLLFSALGMMEAVDLHGGNFLISKGNLVIPDGTIIPIDLECFGDSTLINSNDIISLIEKVYTMRGYSLPDTTPLKRAMEEPLTRIQQARQTQSMRYVPTGTQALYDLRKAYLTNRPTYQEDLADIIEIIASEYDIKSEQITQKMAQTFDEFEIPYFTQQGDFLFLDGVQVGEKRESSAEEASTDSSGSGGSVDYHEPDPDYSSPAETWREHSAKELSINELKQWMSNPVVKASRPLAIRESKSATQDDLSSGNIQFHTGLENYQLICYANAALQALASPLFMQQLKEMEQRHAELSPQGSPDFLASADRHRNRSNIPFHEHLTACCGHIALVIQDLSTSEPEKVTAATEIIVDQLQSLGITLASDIDILSKANEFLTKVHNENWIETAYLTDTQANRRLCLQVMASLLNDTGVISGKELYDAIGFGGAFQDMEEFATQLLDCIGIKGLISHTVLNNADMTNVLAPVADSILSLPTSGFSIQVLLNSHFEEVLLDQATEEGFTHSRTVLQQAPAVLPITLKRFNEHRNDPVFLDEEIYVDLEDGTKITYILQSVGCHLAEGHYITACRYEENGQVQWMEHDDNHVNPIGLNLEDWHAVPSQNAYLIVYHRKEETEGTAFQQ